MAGKQKAQQQVQMATAEQKAKYEQQLQELAEKLKNAEEKKQRALSMPSRQSSVMFTSSRTSVRRSEKTSSRSA